MSVDFLNTLLPDLYACAEQPLNWSGVLDRICRHMNTRSAVIQMLNCVDDALYPEWDIRDSRSSEHAELHDRYVNNQQNPRLNLKIARGLSGAAAIMRDEERFRPGCPHLARLQERLAMIGMGHSISVALRISEDRQLTLLLHRAHGDGREFGSRDVEFLWQLVPHLKQSVNLCEKINLLHDDVDLMKEFADRMNTGIIVVDNCGVVRWQNRYAERIIRESRHLAVVGGKLRCNNTNDHRRLSHFLHEVSSTDQRLLTTIGVPHCSPLQILAIPVLTRTSCLDTARPHSARIALLLSDPDCSAELSPSDISELFGLTPAEAALAAGLCKGMTLQDYAERRGISVGTARIQLKSIFSKTGAGRQSDLIRLLYASVSARTLIEHQH